MRMIKVKQKMSFCFGMLEGTERFARIREYISAVPKNSKNIFEAVGDAFFGNPLISDIAI